MGHYSKKLSSKSVMYMEVAEKKKPYTNVFFEDGTSIMTSYGISETIRRLNSNVVKINMSQAVNLNKVDNVQDNLLTIKDKKMVVSRRKKALFLGLFVAIFNVSFAQTAVSDTIKACNNAQVRFSVLGNDLPLGRIQISQFTQPTAGELVSASNTGYFRYFWNFGVNTTSFQYKIKLINTNTESAFATVLISGSPPITLSGNYPNTTLTTIQGCQIRTSGTTTFISGAKYKLEHFKFTELLPGTTIDAAGEGSVLIQAK